MEIRFKNNRVTHYSELAPGDVFRENDEPESIYLKLNDDWYANPKTGEMYEGYHSIMVTKLNAILYIE